jgi:predicted AlkP superfamily phosphohydrolase/phosphomutase
MKLLVIGIDGGTKEIIENMPMPYTQALFSKAVSQTLNEDLISRGWAEILTGEHASENKAFYLRPFADKSYNFSQSYSKAELTSCSPSRPLWSRLNELGISVGLMNIPTTGPADKVKGFIVSGGGGGLSADGNISPNMLYPTSYLKVLEKNNYTFDVRLPRKKKKSLLSFLEKVRLAEITQKDTFLELASNEKPDFGFHCFRITTEVQYLARYDIDDCIKSLKVAKENNESYVPSSLIHEKLINHYVQLDENIKQIFESLSPENYLFVADHSTALFEYEGNVDVWLEQEGYLEKMSPVELMFSQLKYYLFRVYNILLRKLGLAKRWSARRPITRFSKRRTKAFGTFYDTGNFAGIFINDSDRFGGPVSTLNERKDLVSDICENFNATEVAKRFKLEAKPYLDNFKNSTYQKIMPDIKIHKPDNIYFSGRFWKFIRKNPNLKPLIDDLTGVVYPHSGLKGSDPLFLYSPGFGDNMSESIPKDLRMVYQMIIKHFEK